MKPLILLKNSFHDIKKNKKRSILTMLGIIIGIAAVITIVALGRGFERYTLSQLTPNGDEGMEVTVYLEFNSRSTEQSENIDYFSKVDIQTLKHLEGVKEVKTEQDSVGGNESGTIIGVTGETTTISAEGVDETAAKIVKGRGIIPEDGQQKKRVCVIDQETEELQFKKKIDPIGRTIKIGPINYVIVGVKENFDYNDPNNMFVMKGMSSVEVPNETLTAFQKEKNALHTVTVVLKKGADVDTVSKAITNSLNTSGKFHSSGVYRTYNIQEAQKAISRVLGTITLFISMVAAISLLIAGIGMMNMMYISVSERTKEIGIRRAIGATKQEIQLQFMLEGLIITVIGGLIGYVLGILIAKAVGTAMSLPVYFEVFPIFIALAVSLVIGVFFSWSPAKSAADKNVIDII